MKGLEFLDANGARVSVFEAALGGTVRLVLATHQDKDGQPPSRVPMHLSKEQARKLRRVLRKFVGEK